MTRMPGHNGIEYQLVSTVTWPLPSTISGKAFSWIPNLSPTFRLIPWCTRANVHVASDIAKYLELKEIAHDRTGGSRPGLTMAQS